ncbi:N-acyl homoserine lactonase family protein [Sungkyunkwania multivorans]|uniref:N-acyl homoserine lactonase family protein n=1 Tax=Sungkyunkwania multivorans TaxID=1173618 RepID=A0ABW3D2P9_9FLAO
MKRFLAIILIMSAVACKENKKEAPEVLTKEETPAKPQLKLYTFDGGTIVANNLQLFSQDTTYQGQAKEFANAFYVISHPNGNLIWDAGLPESLVSLPEPFTIPSGNFTVSRNDSVQSQLASIGLTPSDFKYIALSHTHFDHSGTANTFKDATWLVQETEYDYITSEESQKNNTDNYNAIKELTKVQKLKGDFDVFGDGTVIIKSMPGHTPGHQVLFLDLAEHGPLLLTGDLYHFYENREHRRVPIFNSDVEQTKASMEAFEAFAKEKDAKVYLQHQKEDFKKMPKAPSYLY